MADSIGSPVVAGWYHSGVMGGGYFDEINLGGPSSVTGYYYRDIHVDTNQHSIGFVWDFGVQIHPPATVHVKIDLTCGPFLDIHIDQVFNSDYYSGFPNVSFTIDQPFTGQFRVEYLLEVVNSENDFYSYVEMSDTGWSTGAPLNPPDPCECCCNCC